MSSLRGLSVVVAFLASTGAAVAADGAPTPGPAGGPAGTASGPPPLGDGAAVPKTGLEPLPGGPVATDGATPIAPTGSPAAGAPAGAALLPLDGTQGPVATPTASVPATGGATPPMPLLVGGGLLLLAGAGWAWTRLRGGSVPAGAASWVRVPDAGLFGPGTPSLSDGWLRCAVEPTERDVAIAGVLSTLADRRPVLVVAPSEVPVPPVRGYAVHRASVARPTHVAQVLEALEARGEPSVLLLVEDDPAIAQAIAEALPADTAAVVVQTGEAVPTPGWPSVALCRTPDGWTARTGTASVALVAGLDGFRPRGA